ncbi:hypothetical protein FRB99_007421 [Tulasnella sp. 403]|nr:hypothetical protein FRB99_007421 [Tulasnella sp. 403]
MVLRFRAAPARSNLDSDKTDRLSTDAHSPTLPPKITQAPPSTAFELWKQARSTLDPPASDLPPGAHRPLTFQNIRLAFRILRHSSIQLLLLLWTIHPLRILLFVLLNLVRGLIPAARCYSQSLLLDQVQLAVSSHVITFRLGWLLALEFFRMLAEALFEHFATSNERAVQQSIRFRVEYVQMETRLRLDIPSLASPTVQDLLTESDLFARSFNGMGGLGLLSPFDLIRTLTTLTTEIASQSYILYNLLAPSFSSDEEHVHLNTAQTLLVLSALLPTLVSGANWVWTKWILKWDEGSCDSPDTTHWPHALYNPEEAETAERHERMRRLAYDESFKSEVMLFGLAKWILRTWVETRDILMSADKKRSSGRQQQGWKIKGIVDVAVAMEFLRECVRELTLTLQAIPLVLQLSTTTLGNATLYRSSIQTLVSSFNTLWMTFQLTYQSIFLMGAFHAALLLQPSMEPPANVRQPYTTAHGKDAQGNDNGKRGMKIEARNLWFTYPGEDTPVIKGLNLKIEPGEVVAIVGRNGGGKSTLMQVLLRLFDHDRQAPDQRPSQLLINDLPAEYYSPADLHANSTAVFQSFTKLTNASVRENTGMGGVERLDPFCSGPAASGSKTTVDLDLSSAATLTGDEAVTEALKEGGAWDFVQDFRDGLDTRLDAGGFGGGRMGSEGGTALGGPRGRGRASGHTPIGDFRQGYDGVGAARQQQPKQKVALSGGQWQRIALARSFMRPDSDLLVLDEASSQLDAHAQHALFTRLLSPSNRGKRTIVFITHRLSTVRWADKVAFFDDGKVSEFGTHEELMKLEDGEYRSLWGAFANTGVPPVGAGSEERVRS